MDDYLYKLLWLLMIVFFVLYIINCYIQFLAIDVGTLDTYIYWIIIVILLFMIFTN